MSLKDVVNVQITRETTPVSKEGFGTMLILGTHMAFAERIRYYTSPDGVADDFDETSLEYKAALAAFSQEPAPKRVAIGRRAADFAHIGIENPTNGKVYRTFINGELVSFEAGETTTLAQAVQGVIGSINASSQPIRAVALTDQFYRIEPTNPGTPFSVRVIGQEVSPYAASASIMDDLQACQNENSDWYGLVLTNRNPTDVLGAAQWIEGRRKLFGFASNNRAIIDQSRAIDVNSPAAAIEQANFARTFCIYHDDMNQYPEAAWMGKMLPTQPGEATWMFKTLKAINSTKLTETQTANARDKNCNVYENLGGVDIMREGKVGVGEYIDVIIFVDWLTARMTERIYSRLVNSQKIPYNDMGIEIIKSEIRTQLKQGIEFGGLSSTPEFTISAPKASEVDFNDRARRYLPNVKFRATLAGAIHAVDIMGTVTV